MDERKERQCRFVSISEKEGVHDSFKIADRGTIFINGKESYVYYIDEYHFMVGQRCFHIFEFYDRVVSEAGNIVLPGKGLVTREYGTNYRAYEKDSYAHVVLPDIGNDVFEFSNLHIIRETLPLGRYAYDLRHDDEGLGIPCELSRIILVNHLGTIISTQPLLSLDDKCVYLEKDMFFVDGKHATRT